MVKAKVLRAFREGEDDKAKTHKVGDIVDLKETYFDKLKEGGFVERIVVDQEAEVKKLTAENKKLTDRVAELEAEVKKLTGADEPPNEGGNAEGDKPKGKNKK